MDIDLNRFCDKSENAFPALKAPFTQDGKTWATDGHILVGVPELNNVEKRQGTPTVKVIMEALPSISGVGEKIPEIEIYPECQICNGQGKEYACHECDGDGNVYFENKYHQYGPECASCEGDGYIDICPKCQ